MIYPAGNNVRCSYVLPSIQNDAFLVSAAQNLQVSHEPINQEYPYYFHKIKKIGLAISCLSVNPAQRKHGSL